MCVSVCSLHLYLSSRWALQSEMIPVLNDNVRIFPVRPLKDDSTTFQKRNGPKPARRLCALIRTCRRRWAASWGTCRRTAPRWPGASGPAPAAGTGWWGRWPTGRCPAAARSVWGRAARRPRKPLACPADPLQQREEVAARRVRVSLAQPRFQRKHNRFVLQCFWFQGSMKSVFILRWHLREYWKKQC